MMIRFTPYLFQITDSSHIKSITFSGKKTLTCINQEAREKTAGIVYSFFFSIGVIDLLMCLWNDMLDLSKILAIRNTQQDSNIQTNLIPTLSIN